MTAAVVYVLNERTLCWRTQTPGVTSVADSEISAWCYSPHRESLAWAQENTPSGLYMNTPDDDLSSPIPGAALQTYPIVPDGDAVTLKRFHEVSFTVSNLEAGDASAMAFTVSAGAAALGETTSLCTPLTGNAAAGTPEAPMFAACRHMITREASVSPYLVLNLAPDSLTTRWRLHAIDIAWEPAGARSLNR